MICPQCHAANREGDRFCEQCGSPLTTSMEQPFGAPGDIAATLMAAPPGASVLVRLNGDAGEQTYPLGTRVVIGRLDSCDIPIHDKSVSREHARLSRLRDGYVIEDLGSTNGTLVNGKRIDEATLLHAGDSVTIGAIEFRFDQEGANRDEVPLPIQSPWESPSQEQVNEYPFPREGEPIYEAPTIRDLPPMPATFPPMEPFSPVIGSDVAPTSQSPADVSPEGSEQLDAMKAALGFSGQDRTPAPEAPQASEAQPPSREEYGPPVSPFPDQTVAAVRPWESAPPAPAAPEPVPEVTSTSPTMPSGDEELVHEAQTVAYRLTEMISELTARLQDSRAEQARAHESLQNMQGMSQTQESIKQAIQTLASPSLSSDDLAVIREMVDSLAQNPRDVEILMRVAQQSAKLAAILDDYTRLRETVERISGSLGTR